MDQVLIALDDSAKVFDDFLTPVGEVSSKLGVLVAQIVIVLVKFSLKPGPSSPG